MRQRKFSEGGLAQKFNLPKPASDLCDKIAEWFSGDEKGEKEMRKVADLTVDELKQLIATTVWETLQDFLGDPDEGLELQDWVKERLKKSLEARAAGQKGVPIEQVIRELNMPSKRKRRGKL